MNEVNLKKIIKHIIIKPKVLRLKIHLAQLSYSHIWNIVMNVTAAKLDKEAQHMRVTSTFHNFPKFKYSSTFQYLVFSNLRLSLHIS